MRRAVERAVRLTSSELAGRARLIQELRPVPKVRTSENHLTEVIKQLLLNAAQAMDAELPQREITVRTALADDGQVRIDVIDTGCGISPEVRQRIFEPFFTTRPVGEGTGLGLSVCHGIVSAAGGQLQVESRPQGGTHVSVLMPSVDRFSGSLALSHVA